MFNELIGHKVLIRTWSAGVHFGTLSETSADGRQVKLTETRRVHYWDGAASLSQMASEGVSKPKSCRFSVVVPTIVLTEAIEILPLSEAAIANLEAVPIWKV